MNSLLGAALRAPSVDLSCMLQNIIHRHRLFRGRVWSSLNGFSLLRSSLLFVEYARYWDELNRPPGAAFVDCRVDLDGDDERGVVDEEVCVECGEDDEREEDEIRRAQRIAERSERVGLASGSPPRRCRLGRASDIGSSRHRAAELISQSVCVRVRVGG
jgi:hypothetical protein